MSEEIKEVIETTEEIMEEVVEETTEETTEEIEATEETEANKETKGINKKAIQIIAAVVALVALIAIIAMNVNTNINPQGEWVLVRIAGSDDVMESEQIERTHGGEVKYHLKEDGLLVATLLGMDIEGTWEVEGNIVYLEFNDANVELNYLDNGTMTSENEQAVYTWELQ